MRTSPRRPVGLHPITVDLDGGWCYGAIHGSDDGSNGDDADADDDPKGNPSTPGDPLLLAALPRLLDLADDLGARLTLFVITRDLEAPPIRALLSDAHRAGHALMSHSHHHHYDLAARPFDDIVSDLRQSRALLGDVTGVAPIGFRAPGYTQSVDLQRAVDAVGFGWSSSILPSPAYFAIRQGVRLRARLAGGRSASQRGRFRDFTPFYARSSRATTTPLEVPITTAAGLPWLGTTIAMLPDVAGDALTTLALRRTRPEALVFELHAADVVEGSFLPPGQPDAGVSLADKARRLRRTLAAVVQHTAGT